MRRGCLIDLSLRECTLWSLNGIETRTYVDLIEGQSYYVFPKERLFLWPVVKVGFRQATTVKGISVPQNNEFSKSNRKEEKRTKEQRREEAKNRDGEKRARERKRGRKKK